MSSGNLELPRTDSKSNARLYSAIVNFGNITGNRVMASIDMYAAELYYSTCMFCSTGLFTMNTQIIWNYNGSSGVIVYWPS